MRATAPMQATGQHTGPQRRLATPPRPMHCGFAATQPMQRISVAPFHYTQRSPPDDMDSALSSPRRWRFTRSPAYRLHAGRCCNPPRKPETAPFPTPPLPPSPPRGTRATAPTLHSRRRASAA
eukprot:364168-Chlamydomonas_euryale.AAC.3